MYEVYADGRCKRCGLLAVEINLPERWFINDEWIKVRQSYTVCKFCFPETYKELIIRGRRGEQP